MINLLRKIDEWFAQLETRILVAILIVSCRIAMWAAMQLQLYDDYDYIVLDAKEKLIKGATESDDDEETST